MITRQLELARAIGLFVALVIFASTSLDVWILELDWHDQQRVGELFFLAVALVLIILRPALTLSPIGGLALAAIFGLGLLSALYSDYPSWAFREWGRCAGLVAVVLLLGDFGRERWVQLAVIYLMAACAFVVAGMFFVYYGMAFITGIRNLDPFVLLYGFDNARFLGQFQVLLFPLLAVAAGELKRSGSNFAAVLLFLVAVAHWCIAWSLGGRGSWLSLLLVHGALLMLGRGHWRLVRWQVLAASLGVLLFWVLFVLCPEWFGIEAKVRTGLRTGLSARDQLWEGAWAMASQHPWLGVGPLHYSAVWNHIAAHPHQAVLQWSAEWGVPAAALAALLISWGMLRGAQLLRDERLAEPLDAGLWLSLCGALVLAQVDGVFVMPYTEGWLAVIAGVGLARWCRKVKGVSSSTGFYVRCVAIMAFVTLAVQLFSDVPNLKHMQLRFYELNEIGSPPRLWGQGWIPM